jgi:hypothetical protein
MNYLIFVLISTFVYYFLRSLWIKYPCLRTDKTLIGIFNTFIGVDRVLGFLFVISAMGITSIMLYNNFIR